MKYAALAFIAALLLLFGCAGRPSTGFGSDAQIAVGFYNPVVTLLNMSKYWLYGSNAQFSGNVSAANFNGAFSGNATLSNYYNMTQSDAITSQYANKSANENISGSYTFLNNITVLGRTTSVNITAMNVNGSLLPVIDNSFNLGNSTNRWRNITVAGNASIGGLDILSLAITANSTANAANATANSLGNYSAENSTIPHLSQANNFTNASNYMVNVTFYTWVNPYNASTYCRWLNASCEVCVSATVSETRC